MSNTNSLSGESNQKTNKNGGNMNKKTNTGKATDMFNLAALCLAVVSWYTTSEGLILYGFQDMKWTAYVISFAVQTMLFVCNLKLPAWCKTARGWNTVLIPLFTMLLITSSLFSFTYFSSLLYPDNMRKADEPGIRAQMLAEYKTETLKYIDEVLKEAQATAGQKATGLLEKMPLNPERQQKALAFNQTKINDASTKRDEAMKWYENTYDNGDPDDDIYWKSRMTEYDNLLRELHEERAGLEKGNEDTVNLLLIELLKNDTNTDTTELDNKMNEINQRVMDDSQSSGSGFTEIINLTQDLRNSVKEYNILRNIRNSIGSNTVYSNTLEELKALDDYILQLPPKPNNSENEIIKKFDPLKTARAINALIRVQRDAIENGSMSNSKFSQLEISLNLLRSDLNLHPTMAWISLFLALLLDVASMMAGIVSYILRIRNPFNVKDEGRDGQLKEIAVELHYDVETERQKIASDKKTKKLQRRKLRMQLWHNVKNNFLEWIHSWHIFKDS